MFQIPSLFHDLLTYREIAPFILRLALAFIFIGHGYSIKMKSGKTLAKFTGFIEIISGLLLFIGLFVQAAAIAVSLIMVVAIIKVKRKEGFLTDCAFNLLILAVALSLLVLGPGIFSFDLPL